VDIQDNNGFGLIECLLARDEKLFAIDTTEPSLILHRLRNYHTVTTNSVYFWQAHHGLYRPEFPGAPAPHSATLEQALLHVSTSIHFGIYAFSGVNKNLRDPKVISLINKIHKKSYPNKQVLLFIDEQLDIPQANEHCFTNITHKVPQRTSYKAIA
jgi:hypothetical protein